jgi:hypothetical protein
MNWLLFISQLPKHPSSLRVNVWRKLRAAGALGLQNGIWVLPNLPEQVKFLEDLLAMIRGQGACGQIFCVSAVVDSVEKDIVSRFISDRDEEYTEFIDCSKEFLAEIEKESAREKYTFAELEENEQDLLRLSTWLERIKKRDFFSGEGASKAVEILGHCKQVFEKFAACIYERQTKVSDTENH